MILPDDKRALVSAALDEIEICRVSQGKRAAAYRVYGQWIETGRAAGGLALANMLYAHLDRLQSHLFSPSELRFVIDFENHYPKKILAQGEMAARVLSREWERKNIDTLFADGVKQSLAYGACFLKLLISEFGGKVSVNARLVMPWTMGVDNEGLNSLDDQEAILETVYLSKHEAWRRIRGLPNAEKLYRRILAQADKGEGTGVPTSFMHQVLSTKILDVSLANATRPQPGGIVQLSNDPNVATIGPEVAAELIPMHELWVKDDDRGDWTTIQIIEPDILVAPLFKRTNLFCPGTLPYTLLQGNVVPGYIWGRSDITDLMELQSLLTTTLDDIKRIMGVQFDKLLAFPGYDGMTDELYAQFRSAGYASLPQGASVSDLTPQLPAQSLEYVSMIERLMEKISGFANILSGQGEEGVRAGVHADTLMRTASPRLRDRALLYERQCAEAGDGTLAALQAKDARAYWTDPDTGADSEFLLSQLPEDGRVAVDSHSSSPIYHQDHQNQIGFGIKAGFIGGDSAIEMMNFPNKDLLITRWREMQQQKAELIKEHPELLTKGAGKKHA